MSSKQLNRILEILPNVLAEQVNSYARAVEDALPDIFKDVQVKFEPKISEQVVFLAGLRKLYSVITSNYWVLDNSAKILEGQGILDIRIGSSSFSRGSEYHYNLQEMMKELSEIFSKYQVMDLIYEKSYKEIIRELADGC